MEAERTRIEQLESLLAEAKLSQDSLQAQMDSMRLGYEQKAAQAAEATEVAKVAAMKTAKPNAPPIFSGKTNERPDHWLFQMNQYFDATQLHISTQVTFAASYLRDNAAIWWQRQVEGAAANRWPAISTYTAFSEAVKSAFQRPNWDKAARDQLAMARQKTSVREFATKLRDLELQIPNLSEGELLDRFVRGLKHSVRMEVEKLGPSDFAEAVRLAERIDEVGYRLRTNDEASSSRNENRQNRQNRHGRNDRNWQSKQKGSSGSVPMELGSLRPSAQLRKGNGRQDSRRCYGCGEIGHLKASCPSRRSGKERRQ